MHRRNTRVARLVAVSALTLTLLTPSLSAGAVQARGGLYQCRMAATPFPDRITVRFRLATSVAHHAWRIRIWDNGTRVFSAIRRTNGSGDLTVVKAIENLHGRDELISKARDISSGSVCDFQFKV